MGTVGGGGGTDERTIEGKGEGGARGEGGGGARGGRQIFSAVFRFKLQFI